MPDLEPAAIISELQAVFALNPTEIIRYLISLVLARLRAIAGEAQIKVTSNGHPWITGTLRNLRKNISEPDTARSHECLRCAGIKIQPRVPSTELVQHAGREGMLPRGCELFGERRTLVTEAREAGGAESDIVQSMLVIPIPIEPDRVFESKIFVKPADELVGSKFGDRGE